MKKILNILNQSVHVPNWLYKTFPLICFIPTFLVVITADIHPVIIIFAIVMAVYSIKIMYARWN